MSGSTTNHRYLHITRSFADGVTRTKVHVKHVEITESSVHLTGTRARFASVSGQAGDCFHPELACDTGELALIEELRTYLRPSEAPSWLVTRLEAALDSWCDDE